MWKISASISCSNICKSMGSIPMIFRMVLAPKTQNLPMKFDIKFSVSRNTAKQIHTRNPELFLRNYWMISKALGSGFLGVFLKIWIFFKNFAIFKFMENLCILLATYAYFCLMPNFRLEIVNFCKRCTSMKFIHEIEISAIY